MPFVHRSTLCLPGGSSWYQEFSAHTFGGRGVRWVKICAPSRRAGVLFFLAWRLTATPAAQWRLLSETAQWCSSAVFTDKIRSLQTKLRAWGSSEAVSEASSLQSVHFAHPAGWPYGHTLDPND